MIEEIYSDWTEKYRPKTLNDIILNEDTRKLIKKYINDGIIDNILMCSRPGQGKTSLAKLLAYEVFKCDTLYINASDENNVDVVRNKISGFSRTRSSDGNFKIVILDEADGFANVQSQRILRALMEEVSENTRFIITANNKNRILEAIRSRCKFIDITPPLKDTARRVLQILKNEQIDIDLQKNGENLQKLIEHYYPDIRSIIKNLQASVYDNKLVFQSKFIDDSVFLSTIYNYIVSKKYMMLREYIINNENTFNNDYQNLLIELYNYIIGLDKIDEQNKASAVILISEYLYKADSVVDQEINTMACLFKLAEIL